MPKYHYGTLFIYTYIQTVTWNSSYIPFLSNEKFASPAKLTRCDCGLGSGWKQDEHPFEALWNSNKTGFYSDDIYQTKWISVAHGQNIWLETWNI